MEDMSRLEKKFRRSKFKTAELPFKPVPVMNKVLNELSEILIQGPPRVEVRSSDPAAVSGKKTDMNVLKTKHIYERGLNRAGRIIGEPPESMDLSKRKSNVADF